MLSIIVGVLGAVLMLWVLAKAASFLLYFLRDGSRFTLWLMNLRERRDRRDLVFLKALEEGDAYGPEIRERIRIATGHTLENGVVLKAVALSDGSMYPSLRRLADAGFLSRTKRPSKSPRPGAGPRFYYSITEKGRTWVGMFP